MNNNFIDSLNISKKNIKVAFFPYKASMWPCLDSVYKACLEDPYCSASVVPVPYYELGSKLTIFEKDLFPSEIETIHYENYIVENEKPDIVFVHNPFDNFNTVTQINSKFFSETLSNLGCKVVYIPYYNARYEYSTNTQYNMPVHHNAWKIVVQSEALKQRFIENNHNPEKIKSLGSPKSDYIYNLNKTNIASPAVWSEKLKNKTVFFYNTHLLKFRLEENAFNEANMIFDIFEERDDIALIWRPHPLTGAVLSQDEDYIKKSYHKLFERFISLKNTILDLSSDYSVAFSNSDAYIGDESSLILEYALMNKPICVNQHVINKMNYRTVFFDFNSLYAFEDKNSIINFISQVTENNDPKKLERKNAVINTLGSFDGKTGYRIWESIKEDFLQPS